MIPPRGQPAPRSILFIKPGSLGDVIHALPCADALRGAFPDARLTWVIDPRWAPVLTGSPVVDELLPFPRENFRGPAGALRAAGWLAAQRRRRPDLCIDLQGLLRSALIARAAGSRRIIGLSDAREGARFFYHQTSDVTGVQHAVERYLRILPRLDVAIPEVPRFPLGPGEPVADVPTDFVLLHPFARGSGKSLFPRQVRELCQLTPNHHVVVAGFGKDPGELPENATDLTGRTSLEQLTWLIRRARSVVSVDSGPMHIAAAAGVPLLSLHTWSDPRKVGPYSPSAWILQGGEIRRQSLASDATILPQIGIDARQLCGVAGWIMDHSR